MALSLIDSHHLHLVLTPYPPMALNRSDFKKYISLTRVIGDISMLNILSAKSPLPLDNFRLFSYIRFRDVDRNYNSILILINCELLLVVAQLVQSRQASDYIHILHRHYFPSEYPKFRHTPELRPICNAMVSYDLHIQSGLRWYNAIGFG